MKEEFRKSTFMSLSYSIKDVICYETSLLKVLCVKRRMNSGFI